MTLTSGSDSDGNTYEVWQQDQASSCGIASIWMARSLVKGACIDEDEWPLAVRIYYNAVNKTLVAAGGHRYPMCLNPAAFKPDKTTFENTFAVQGINAMEVAGGLRSEGLKANALGAKAINPFNFGPNKAVIALFMWRPAGSGGHFLCAARKANNGMIVYLDPGDGTVNELPNNGVYTGRYGLTGDLVAVVNVWR